ncbi:MAG: ATP-dependent DNA helicase [Actinomycetota bacterium]|nr:ATP-dependent DNA helicase [Actinomycetota bacterium]
MTADIRVDPTDWSQRIAPGSGPQLIVGGPGTGKTEFLVRRAVHLIEEGNDQGLLVLSFSRRGATDLDARIRAATTGPAPTTEASTYHSFAARLLEAYAPYRGWEQSPDVLPGPDQKRLVAELLESEDPHRWSPAYRSLLTTRTFADEVTDFVLRCREQLIGPTDLAERSETRADWRGLSAFLDRYDQTLRDRSVVDYGTLLSEAASILADPATAEDLGNRYRHVLVDEYQDTTHAQSILLQRLASGHGRVTAAADPYQSIYSFRGADIENVVRFPGDFAFEGRPAERLVLTTSFRVPEAILDAAVRITAHELPGAAGKVTPAPGEGSVEAYRFSQQVEEAEWIASEIHQLNLEQRIPLNRMAVFTRSKTRFLAPLSRSLDRRDIRHQQPDNRLVDQPAIRFILDTVTAATNADGELETDRAVRRILLGPMFETPPALFAELSRRRGNGGQTWADIIRAGINDGARIGDLLADPAWAKEDVAVTGLWQLWSTLPQIADLATSPQREQDRAAWSSFTQVLERWNERNPSGTLLEYREHIELEEFEASPLLSYEADAHDRVTVTSLHQAKGLDFDVVFIADAVEGAFPDLRTRDSLLGTRHLQPHLPTDTAGYLAFRLQEERRLAYTAMTRATRRVVWTATDSGFDIGGGTPSRFLPLAIGARTIAEAISEPAGHHRPITTGQFEAAMRRSATDPSLPPPQRLAAIETLARGADLGLREPARFAGMREAGPDTNVVQLPPRLSPSQATAYETCPRRYVLERKLAIGAEPSVHMDFGTLIHGILERVENAAAERGDQHGTVEEAITVLDETLEPGDFGGAAFDAAWRGRASSALENIYSLWPSSGSPVGSETDLTVHRGDVQWLGRADRIEDRGGSLAIVDYKTGQLTSLDEAATSLQLGFYVIGAREDPDIAEKGPATAAEMWFPMHPQKRSIATRSFDVANLEDVESRMAAVADGVSREDWTPTPSSACDRCDVRILCPAMPEGKEAFAT